MSNQKLITNYNAEKDLLVEQLAVMLPKPQFQVFNDDASLLGEKHPNPLLINVGDKISNFSLPDATGTIIHSKDLLKKGSMVLTFYRGEWCPYCNLYLQQLQNVLPQIKDKNASLVAISPQKPDNSLSMKEKNKLRFHVLSDLGNQLAKKFTTVFKYGEQPLQAMADLGYDFNSFYADDAQELPIPATFIILSDGSVSFAKSQGGDYRLRVEVANVLNAL